MAAVRVEELEVFEEIVVRHHKHKRRRGQEGDYSYASQSELERSYVAQ